MKQLVLALSVISSASLLCSCTISSGPYNGTTGYANYTGYTVNYGYAGRDDDSGVGTYRGYGGWASSYYAPGYRGGFYR